MTNFIDRRLNPKDKSLGNRRRFLKRVRGHVKDAVNQSVRDRSIKDVDRGERVGVPADGVREPRFRYDPTKGSSRRVFPGNKDYRPGDRIRKPPQGGAGGRGRKGADEGGGEDEFMFVLSREEFLDIFFEDLELPNLVKQTLKEIDAFKPRRAGFTLAGNPANLSVENTMRNALGRRIALKRPKDDELRELQSELFDLEAVSSPTAKQRLRRSEIEAELEKAARRRTAIPWIDPLDVRYRAFAPEPQPNANAVMFCLMDVSASMGEREKDLAKRFFVLLHLFLQRRYDRIDVVFVRHTHLAGEVDEETFFYARETGGTVVSTALVEMERIIRSRYPASEWNIYGAQASDGENIPNDSQKCRDIMSTQLMKLCQYFAYIEILDEAEAVFLSSEASGEELWQAYRQVSAEWPSFAMKRIASPTDIYPVFRELFSRELREIVSG
ncbi:MAG: YeaH/YhbH family protein [Pseudomonadota bacterium]